MPLPIGIMYALHYWSLMAKKLPEGLNFTETMSDYFLSYDWNYNGILTKEFLLTVSSTTNIILLTRVFYKNLLDVFLNSIDELYAFSSLSTQYI